MLATMPRDDQQGPHPAAVGFVWKAIGTVAVPIAVAALILWRDAALTNAKVADLERLRIADSAKLEAHLEQERDEKDARAVEARQTAVAQAQLETSLTSVRTTLDAILQALPRRR